MQGGTAAVERVFREEYGRLIASLVGRFGDIDIAEEAAGEALVAALEKWPESGVPPNPGGWLTTTAGNRAIDRIRREKQRDAKHQAAFIYHDDTPHEHTGPVEDDRLRLLFTCCHPALAPQARIALTLRLLGGLTVAEIAQAFLVPETTMAQRITRAKKKIAAAKVPYRVPEAANLPERLGGVLAVLFLVFNEGYLATGDGDPVRAELTGEAIRLIRVLRQLLPEEPEVAGLLGLLLLTEARREARVRNGQLVPLGEQDRAGWDRGLIAEGHDLVRECLAINRPGRYQILAAINAVHTDAPTASDTDWSQVVALLGGDHRGGRRVDRQTAPEPVSRVKQRFPATPAGELKLLPSPRRNPDGRRPMTIAMLGDGNRRWVDTLGPLHSRDGAEFDKSKIVPYAYRHSYAQRHADAGVGIDVLAELLDHRNLNVTRTYYRVGEDRRRAAVDTVTAMSFDTATGSGARPPPCWTPNTPATPSAKSPSPTDAAPSRRSGTGPGRRRPRRRRWPARCSVRRGRRFRRRRSGRVRSPAGRRPRARPGCRAGRNSSRSPCPRRRGGGLPRPGSRSGSRSNSGDQVVRRVRRSRRRHQRGAGRSYADRRTGRSWTCRTRRRHGYAADPTCRPIAGSRPRASRWSSVCARQGFAVARAAVSAHRPGWRGSVASPATAGR